MRKTITRALVVGGIVSGLALGGTGIAFATTGSPESSSSADEQDPVIKGSVPAPADATEGSDATENDATANDATENDGTENGTESNADDTAAEATESKALGSLATVTPAEASAAALAAVPGTAGKVELGNEDGFVAYSVEVTIADGSNVDVIVDAGNADILAQDTDTETND